MDTIEVCIEKLTKLMKQKYQEILKIEKITSDIEDSLKRNDSVTIEMLMNMRMEVMQNVDAINGEIDKIITSNDEEDYQYFKGLLKVDTQKQAMETEFEDEKMLMLISLRIKNVLNNVIIKDEAMSKRLLGKDSFYAKK